MAWTHSQVLLRQIDASESDAQLYGRLASSILFANSSFRADPAILISNHRGQSGLWGYSISGDLPIVLLKVEKQANMQLVRQLIQAHVYWRLKGITVDLVIWNEEHNGYRQSFQNDIQALIPTEVRDRPGGIFVRAAEQISSEDRILFQTVARIIIADSGGTLADHVKRKQLSRAVIPRISPPRTYTPSPASLTPSSDLLFLMEQAASHRMGASMSLSPAASKKRLRPGSTSLPTPTSAPSFQKAEAPIPGRKMPMNCASHPGTTIRFAIREEKPFISGMKRPPITGQPPPACRRLFLLYYPSRAGLQRLRTYRRRHLFRNDRIRRYDRRYKIHQNKNTQRVRPCAYAFGDRLYRMGTR